MALAWKRGLFIRRISIIGWGQGRGGGSRANSTITEEAIMQRKRMVGAPRLRTICSCPRDGIKSSRRRIWKTSKAISQCHSNRNSHSLRHTMQRVKVGTRFPEVWEGERLTEEAGRLGQEMILFSKSAPSGKVTNKSWVQDMVKN